MGPLICWDIVSEGLNRRINLKKDLAILENIGTVNNWDFTATSWRNRLIWEDKVIIITDYLLNITHVTENMYTMNGYTLQEVVGKSPKMFQGMETESIQLEKINKALLKQKPFTATVTNYKKNGDTYKCYIEAYPVFNKKRKLVNFIALENLV